MVDLADGMLKIAKERCRSEGHSEIVELIAGDALHLPYASDSLDAVFMSFALELFDTAEIPEVLGECQRVMRPGGRIAVVGISKSGANGVMVHAFEWTHQHFPNFLDCRPIFVRHALEAAGLRILSTEIQSMWISVEIVLAAKSL